MTFISLECENILSLYEKNLYGEKKDKRIKNWLNLLSELPELNNVKNDLISGVNILLN